MKRLFLLFLLVLPLSLPAQEAPSRDKEEINKTLFSAFLRNGLPGGLFYQAFLENYAPGATFLIEESGGFSLTDDPRLLFEGEPEDHVGWNLDGLSIASSLRAGPAFSLPSPAVEALSLQGFSPLASDFGVGFLTPRKGLPTTLRISGVFSRMGGFIGSAPSLLSPHPTERGGNLSTQRRRLRSQTLLEAGGETALQGGTLLYALQGLFSPREFNDLAHRSSLYREDAQEASALAKWNKGEWNLYGAFSWKGRDRMGAELGLLPEQTTESDRLSLWTAVKREGTKSSSALSLLLEGEEEKSSFPGSSWELMDNDGAEIFPTLPQGKRRSLTLRGEDERELALLPGGAFTLRTEAEALWIHGDPLAAMTTPLLFDGSPLGVLLWKGSPGYTQSRQKIRSTLSLNRPLTSWIDLLASGEVLFQNLHFSRAENRWNRLRAGASLGLLFHLSSRWSFLAAAQDAPYELGYQEASFLESGSASGEQWSWNDRNSDGLFQSGEEGSLQGYRGGATHSLDPDFLPPRRTQALLSLKGRLSRIWELEVQGLTKRVSSLPWARYAQEYGHSETRNGRELYLLDNPFTGFLLSNSPFSDKPFTSQLLFRIRGEKAGKWVFQFSFMAHLAMGQTAFGNGAQANRLFGVNESQADPNSWINAFGRLDGDRAFVGKIYGAFSPFPGFTLGMNIKYRDGDPFAFLEYLKEEDRLILWYQTIKAEDKHGVKGGPREDCLWDISLRGGYTFRLGGGELELALTLFNAADLGSELSEDVFSGGLRHAAELQIPRSLRWEAVYRF